MQYGQTLIIDSRIELKNPSQDDLKMEACFEFLLNNKPISTLIDNFKDIEQYKKEF